MADVSPSDHIQGSTEIRDKTLPTIKALGVTWEVSNDLLTFPYAAPPIPDQLTKRVVTSFAAKIFDPLQILCPFTIQAKILLQKAWSRGLTWDEKLPDDLSKSWKQWSYQLTHLRELKLKRCLRQDQSVDTQSVHTFVDASMQAYASVSYIQNIYLDGTVSVLFIAAKSRVAPLKDLTAQKLELLSAVLGLRLSNYISRSLQIPLSQHHFWTDSQNVIYWVNGNSSKFKPFVAHRVEEIQKSTSPSQWKHLPGAINPADIATRGITSEQLVASETWINGPSFLYSGPWPEQRHVLPD
jgi:hypothetical protein